MQPYGKIGTIVGLAMLAALSPLLIQVPPRPVDFQILGLSVHLSLSMPWFFGGVLALLTAVQSDAIMREHPAAQGMGLGYAVTFWPLPCLWALLGLPLLQGEGELWIGASALVYALLLAAILSVQYASLSSGSARWVLTLLASGAVYALLRAIIQLRLSPSVMALAVGAAGGALALSFFRSGPGEVGRTWGRAALVALIVGQAGWAVAFWEAKDLATSLFLFGLFYLLISLFQQQMLGKLSRLSVLQYAVAALAGLGAFWHYGG